MGIALDDLRSDGLQINPEDIERLSTLLHHQIRLDGRYHFTLPEPLPRGRLTPLRDSNDPAEQVFESGPATRSSATASTRTSAASSEKIAKPRSSRKCTAASVPRTSACAPATEAGGGVVTVVIDPLTEAYRWSGPATNVTSTVGASALAE